MKNKIHSWILYLFNSFLDWNYLDYITSIIFKNLQKKIKKKIGVL